MRFQRVILKIVSTVSILGVVLFLTPPPTVLAGARTTSVWTTTDSGGINVIPYVRVDKKALFVDFDHFTSKMDYIYYNLNYVDKNSSVKGGVEGSFITNPLPIYGSFGGFDYVRRQLLFGTCSQGTCVYSSPKSVTLTVNTHYGSGGQIAQVTQVLSLPDNQF